MESLAYRSSETLRGAWTAGLGVCGRVSVVPRGIAREGTGERAVCARVCGGSREKTLAIACVGGWRGARDHAPCLSCALLRRAHQHGWGLFFFNEIGCI